MPDKVRIALDAMGGDHGPAVVIPGAELALDAPSRHRVSAFRQSRERSSRCSMPCRKLKAAARSVVHTDVAITMDDKPSQALRYGRWKSSMWLAIDAVKKGEADVAVSAGNTGALMAMAKFQSARPWPGIERPAIAALWPTLQRRIGRARCRRLDRRRRAASGRPCGHGQRDGARAVRFERPTVGLLNIGVEEVKGLGAGARGGPHPARRAAAGFRLSWASSRATTSARAPSTWSSPKALPATSRSRPRRARRTRSRQYLRSAMSRTWRAQLGYLFARQAFRTLREKMDPRKVNGGVFLGLNGIVIKSHGGTDAEGFAAAIDIGYDMVRYELLAKINEMLIARTHASSQRARAAEPLRDVMRSVVLGCGSYLPERVLTNDELARTVDTSDEWIVQRTGIRERHIAADGRTHLGSRACTQRARRLPMPRSTRRIIDLIVLATSTPDNTFPATRSVGAGRAWHHARRGVRPAGGVLGLRLRAGDGRRAVAHRALQARAGDRRGDLLAHSRLERSHDLRAVRRRRRRRRARGAGAARARATTAGC